MSRDPAHNQIAAWKKERYLLGELPQEEMDLLRQLEAQDPAFKKALDDLRQDSANILESHPPAWMARKITSRVQPNLEPPKVRTWGNAFPTPFWAVLIFLVVLPFVIKDYTDNHTGLGDDRIKGLQPRLELYRKLGESSEKLSPSTFAKPGDLVQIRYLAPLACYGTVVSLDGRGTITWHMPEAGGRQSVPMEPGKSRSLPYAYELDDAPYWETFWMIVSDKPFALNSVEKALQNVHLTQDGPDTLFLPENLKAIRFTLRKVEP